jgi:hypothetical protein
MCCDLDFGYCTMFSLEFWLQSDWPVHQLWPPSGDKRRTDLDIVFFHGLQLTANDINLAWISTWTQRGHDIVCWPQEWLPCDLGEQGEAVRIFSVSYDVHVLTSPHDHVSEVADNLFQNFVDCRYGVTYLSFPKWHAAETLSSQLIKNLYTYQN